MDECNLVYEYEKYYQDALCKSKNLLFSRAEEIAMHKIFFGQLKKKTKNDAGLERLLQNRGDVLDEICRFGKDHYKLEQERLCEKVLEEWMRDVMKIGDECLEK